MASSRKTASVMSTLLALSLAPTVAMPAELRATFAPECPTTKFPVAATREGFLTALAVSMASSLIDTGIAAAKRAVNPGNAVLEGRFTQQGLYSYQLFPSEKGESVPAVAPSSGMGCLVIAAGQFDAGSTQPGAMELPFSSDREDGASKLRSALGIKAGAQLDIYLEAYRLPSTDKTAVAWKPSRLYVGEYLNRSMWAGRTRGLSVEVRLYKPGSAEAFIEQNFSFGPVRKPVDRGPSDFNVVAQGTWAEMPAAPAIPDNYSATVEGKSFDPFTLEVRIVESPKPYALAQAFVGAVEDNADTIKTSVTEHIDPDATKEATLTAQEATLEAIGNYMTATTSSSEACEPAKLADSAGKLNCSITNDRVAIARTKAQAACKTRYVASCAEVK